MANRYVGSTWTIDSADINYAGLFALKGSDIASGDDIVFSGPYTITYNPGKNTSLKKIDLGTSGSLIIPVSESGFTHTFYDTSTVLYGSTAAGGVSIIGTSAASPVTIKANTTNVWNDTAIRTKTNVYTNVVFDNIAQIGVSTGYSVTNCLIKNSTGTYAWIIYGMPAVWTGNAIQDVAGGTFRIYVYIALTDAQYNTIHSNVKLIRTAAAAGHTYWAPDEDTGTSYVKFIRDTAPWGVAPTWNTTTGIQTLTANSDGTLKATWGVATASHSQTVGYRIYVRSGSAPNSFGPASAYFLKEVPLTTGYIYRDAAGVALDPSATYYAVVRAVDADGNEDTNTTALSCQPTLGQITRIDEITQAILGLLL